MCLVSLNRDLYMSPVLLKSTFMCPACEFVFSLIIKSFKAPLEYVISDKLDDANLESQYLK